MDGKEHPVLKSLPGVTVVTRQVHSRLIEIVDKKDGQLLSQGTCEVCADGKTLTAKVSGIDAAGKSFGQVIVFEGE